MIRSLGAALLLILATFDGGVSREAASNSAPAEDAFEARALIGLSDADMVATAYVDHKLGAAVGPDTMTVLGFDGRQEPSSTVTLQVSNSVAGPPAGLALTPDGRFAIVVETLGPRPESGRDVGLENLPPGRKLTVVDIMDASRPHVVQELQGPAYANSVSVSADGTRVAVAVDAEGDGRKRPLVVYAFAGGRLGDASVVPIPGWAEGHDLIDATFAPTGSRIALLDRTARQVSLFDMDASSGRPVLKPWGDPISVDQRPFLVKFSPEGFYVFVNSAYDVPVRKAPYGYPRGTVSAIRLDAERDATGRPVHLMVSHVQAGKGSEGMTISPDGRYVITTNREGSAFPIGDPRRTPYASLSLFGFDARTGQLHPDGDYAFEGVLPEGAAFDRSSRRIAVAAFQDLDPSTGRGRIDFWGLSTPHDGSDSPKLVKTGRSIAVQRGMQILMTAP